MLPFEQAKPRVRQLLLEGSTRRALRQYLLVLAAELGVEGVDLEVSGSPLLQ
jgi:peptidyl-prolyl cis-trans isomerase C